MSDSAQMRNGESFSQPTPQSIPKSFTAIKASKRGLSRESLSDAKNLIRRAAVDRIAITEHSLAAGWRYGCWLFDNKCYICGAIFTDKNPAHADHVVPPIEGGSGNPGNMLPAHRSCNHNKADTDPELYFKNKLEILNKIHRFQKAFDYMPDKTIYLTASAIASSAAESISLEILHEKNKRELSAEDTATENFAVPVNLLPIVQNYMRTIHYYFKAEDFSISAQAKMRSYTRRILQKWYSEYGENEDMFSQSEETLKLFVQNFCLEITAHPQSLQRAHRAFRILAEVFESEALISLYQDSVPVTLSDLTSASSNTETWLTSNELKLLLKSKKKLVNVA